MDRVTLNFKWPGGKKSAREFLGYQHIARPANSTAAYWTVIIQSILCELFACYFVLEGREFTWILFWKI